MKARLPVPLVSIPLLLAVGMAGATPSYGQSGDLEQRVQRLERLLENQVLKEMLVRLEDMQRELEQLRGRQEVHGHEIKRMLSRQRELYMDVDRRLAPLERMGVQANVTSPPQQNAVSGAQTTSSANPAPSDTGSALSPTDAVAEQKAYEKAFTLLTEGRYEQAQKAFGEFLAAYPNGSHAANAQYWLAESHYLSRNFDQALKQFQALLDQYPSSPKAPKAMLKIGFVHYEKGDWTKARKTLEVVVEQYVGTTSARLAKQRLVEMKKENR